MATTPNVKVMISSRCNDPFSDGDPTPLTDLRRELKGLIESQLLFDQSPFTVWINEDAEALDHTSDSWDACLKQVRECDILIVLFNGNAGWAKTGEDVGICHAEYAEGLKYSPGKVRLLEIPLRNPGSDAAQNARDARFKVFKANASAFRGAQVRTKAGLFKEVGKCLVDAVRTQVRRGSQSARAGRFDLGAALQWSRMDFAGRRSEMVRELVASLSGRPAAATVDGGLVVEIAGRSVFLRVHGIPAAFTVAAAREPVGRPHLEDYQFVGTHPGSGGPVHVVACHRTVTETQAMGFLGFPDGTVVVAPFGVYVADDIQKMQYVFLANCRDPAQTRLAAQRFWEWLEQADESTAMAMRAMARSRIVKAIADERAPTPPVAKARRKARK